MSDVPAEISEAPTASRLAPFQYPDFVNMWVGAFLSFTGSWIQNVAQGYLVYDITNSRDKLVLVSFFGSIPMSVLGPFAGAVTDLWHKRNVLIVCQLVYMINAALISAGIYFHFVTYEMIVVVAIINGFTSTVEIPTRQSIISRTVPREVLHTAIPFQAMTFNLARIVGPLIGGVLLSAIGAEACYFVNSISFIALIFGVMMIRSDLAPQKSTGIQPISDILFEGIRYTLRDIRLRTLFLMECCLSVFGLAYIPMIPAFAKDVLGLQKGDLARVYIAVGIGALLGLVTLVQFSQKQKKAFLVRASMTSFGIALFGLSFIHNQWLAYPLFSVLGMSAIMQFNATNSLFQTLSPEALRGRVISMHVWALSGAASFALPFFGKVAEHQGVPTAMLIGGSSVMVGAIIAWARKNNLDNLEDKSIV